MKCFSVITIIVLLAISTSLAAPNSRVINGYDAEEGQFPYQVLISVGGNPTCGGAILTDRFVITSARCVTSSGTIPAPAVLFTVQYGDTDRRYGQQSKIANIIVNKNYNKLEHDLAILELVTPLKLSTNVQPIQVDANEVPVESKVTITGWGTMSLDFQLPTLKLQYYDEETVLSTTECANEIGQYNDNVMCLGHRVKRGACDLDFGGPAMYENKLVGIGAYRIDGKCGTDKPDVYTKISKYYNWIMATIQ